MDPCDAKVILNVFKNKRNVFQFDLCDVVDCKAYAKAYKTDDVYSYGLISNRTPRIPNE